MRWPDRIRPEDAIAAAVAVGVSIALGRTRLSFLQNTLAAFVAGTAVVALATLARYLWIKFSNPLVLRHRVRVEDQTRDRRRVVLEPGYWDVLLILSPRSPQMFQRFFISCGGRTLVGADRQRGPAAIREIELLGEHADDVVILPENAGEWQAQFKAQRWCPHGGEVAFRLHVAAVEGAGRFLVRSYGPSRLTRAVSIPIRVGPAELWRPNTTPERRRPDPSP